VALDAGAIDRALDHREKFTELGVGLLGIAEGGTVVEHIPADYAPRGRYTRDRAYVESQVWNRYDYQSDIEDAPNDSDIASGDEGLQRGLSAFGDGQ
jgi:hypothetical protein